MGALSSLRILEIGGIGPVPFAGMLFADMGAEVLRLQQPGARTLPSAASDPSRRGRQTLEVDLKTPRGLELALALAERADLLIEGFRPGVMERLRLGPAELLARNPRLVYGRMTGYGQDGPMAGRAGHDINYIALSGALGAARRAGERPLFPVNMLGDYGGGAMFLVFGTLSAVLEARESGQGQVVDAAMVDGAALLTTIIHELHAVGHWSEVPGTNLLDSGAPFYEVYATSDGGHVAVGALEPQFYGRLLELLEIPAEEMPQYERERWPQFKLRLAQVFAGRSGAEWEALLEGEDACATVVRGPFDAHRHPHLAARGTFIELDGIRQVAPAPRLSRTPAHARPAQRDPRAALERWGLEPAAYGY